MGQFQRTRVIPEVDAYRYSKIEALAAAKAKVGVAYTPVAATILNRLQEDIAVVMDTVGDNEEIVITMSIPCAVILDQADKITKKLDVTAFAQGGVDLKVKSLDGIPIIRVPSARLKTLYTFNDGTTVGQTVGGFVASGTAKAINWLITVKKSVIALSKTDKMRIFTPDINQKADAWKLDYRKFHELWIPDNQIDGIYANIGV